VSIPERRLMFAVVGLAVSDACAMPVLTRHKQVAGLKEDAFTAMDFLMTDVADAWLTWLDIDPPMFRKRVLDVMFDGKASSLSENRKRAFRSNYEAYRVIKQQGYEQDGENLCFRYEPEEKPRTKLDALPLSQIHPLLDGSYRKTATGRQPRGPRK